jgi:predicted NBD/HSP70 family sugar kinase
VSPVPPQDPWVQVAEILRLIRTGEAQTRPELADATGLGRNVVTLRIQAALDLGLVRPSGEQRSRGGRAAEVWEPTGGAGTIAIGIIGYAHLRIVIADMRLQVTEERNVEWDTGVAPELTCERLAEEIEGLLATHPGADLWGMCLGLLAPVRFDTGRNADPVTGATALTRWPLSFDARAWLIERLRVPVWVESVANLATLGAAAEPGAPADLVFVRMGVGVGSGIVSDGNLHRGADWIAGEMTHVTVQPDSDRVCVCGRLGCLETFATEQSIETDALRVIAEGRSQRLAKTDPAKLTAADVVEAADAGDVACVEIVLRAADALGRVLAGVVTWFNPRRVVVGGNRLAGSALFQNALRRTLNTHALGASLEHLELRVGDPHRGEEVRGALAMVRDALLSAEYLVTWGPHGSPVNTPELLTRSLQT